MRSSVSDSSGYVCCSKIKKQANPNALNPTATIPGSNRSSYRDMQQGQLPPTIDISSRVVFVVALLVASSVAVAEAAGVGVAVVVVVIVMGVPGGFESPSLCLVSDEVSFGLSGG